MVPAKDFVYKLLGLPCASCFGYGVLCVLELVKAGTARKVAVLPGHGGVCGGEFGHPLLQREPISLWG